MATRSWVVSLAVAGLVLAACGDDTSDTATTTTVRSTSTSTTSTSTTSTSTTSTSTTSTSTSRSTEGRETIEIQVYFADQPRFAANTEPFETAVARTVPDDGNLAQAALDAYFAGPTAEEKAKGLEALTSGCTGFSKVSVADSIARVYLTGPCSAQGSTFTIAGPVMATLKALPGIDWVKLYDASGQTGSPDDRSDSIPDSLNP